MKRPEIGEKFTAKVDRISPSGNGIIDLAKGHINLGPVSEDSVGKEIEAEMVGGIFAQCLTQDFTPDNYEIEFEKLGRRSSSKTKRNEVQTSNASSESSSEGLTFFGRVEFCDECNSVMRSSDGTWNCTSCNFKKEKKRSTIPLSSEDSQPEAASTDPEEQQNGSDRIGSPSSDSMKNDGIVRDTDESTDLAVLRERAKSESVEKVPENATTSSQSKPEYTRSQAVVEYVKARADGFCEGCDEPAPFTSKTGEPYLHAHHIHELSDGGSDTPSTVIALCPNCHYRVHHGQNGEEYNRRLIERVESIEDNH